MGFATAGDGPPRAREAPAPRLPPLFDSVRRRMLLQLVGLGLLQAGLAAASALAVRVLFNTLSGGAPPGSAQLPGPLGPVLVLGAGSALVAGAALALRRRSGWLAESLGQHYVAEVRLALLAHLFKLPPRRHQGLRHGHLMARLTGDLGALHRWAGRTVAPLLVGSASFALLVATVAWVAPGLALAAALVCAPAGAWAWRVSARLERALRAERTQRWALAGQVGERLAEAAVVQANAQAGRELRRLRRRQRRLHDAALLRAREAALLRALPAALATLMLGLLAGWGSWQVAAGAWSSGALAGLLTLSGLALAPLRDFAVGLGGWRNWRVSREKLNSFLSTEPLPAGGSQPAPQLHGRGCLRLEALVAVPGMVALDADLAPRETLALQGASGSGKSALLEAVAGLLVPASGVVRLGGEPGAATADPLQRAQAVALVASDLPLLRGSVAGNLRYRRKGAPSEDLQQALRTAGVQALCVAQTLDLGSPVAEGGRNLPRVLRARLLLARALVDAPALLLIDDFDDLLEGNTSADAALAALLSDPPCTVVIATRRPEWAARCSRRALLVPAGAVAPARAPELARVA